MEENTGFRSRLRASVHIQDWRHQSHYHAAAAAAMSLQSCPTLCDPIDGSPPGSPVPGVLQARTLERVAISFSNAWKWKVKVKSLSRVWLCATPWTAAHQAPPSLGFSRQEDWSGCHCLLRHYHTSNHKWTLSHEQDREARRAAVHGVTRSWMWQSGWTTTSWTVQGCGEEISSCLIATDPGQHFLIFCLDLANSVFLLETLHPQGVHTLSFELFSSVVPQSPQAGDECLVWGDLSIKSQDITLLPRMFGILWSPSESFSSFTAQTAQQLTLETDLWHNSLDKFCLSRF